MEAAKSPENSVYLQQTAGLYISDSNSFYFKKINIFSFVPC
jgi:hypothetical protein